MKTLTLALGALLLASPAFAGGIVCHDEYQVVNGREISTPYCADRYIAKVARENGWKVTGKQIHNQHDLKAEVCQNVGDDIRIQIECAQYLDEDSGRD